MGSSSAAQSPFNKVSVIVPLFQGEKFIGKTLTSIASQTVAPNEIIVVNDGSTDAGPSIAASFPNVTVVHQENQGIGRAKNAGVKVASSPWLAFIDQDDYWFPNHLQELQRLSTQCPQAGLIATTVKKYRIDRIPPKRLPQPFPPRRNYIDYFAKAAHNHMVVHTSGAAVSREAFESVGGFIHLQGGGGDDLEFWAKVALSWPVAKSGLFTAIWAFGTGGFSERHYAELSMNRDNKQAGSVEGHQNAPKIDEVSSSVRTVAAALSSGSFHPNRKSLEIYIDGRTTRGWKSVLLHGGQFKARILSQQLRHPWRWTAVRYRVSAALPAKGTTWIVRRLRRASFHRRS